MLGIAAADHEETSPDGSTLVISRLVCSLAGQKQAIQFLPGSLAHRAYGSMEAIEEFRCNYGLNSAYRDKITSGNLKVTGVDSVGEVRMVELSGHAFFLATLFLPQHSSTPDRPHPLILAYLQAVLHFHTHSS